MLDKLQRWHHWQPRHWVPANLMVRAGPGPGLRISGAAVTQPLQLQGMPWRCTQEHNFTSQVVSRVSQRVLQDLGEWSVRALSLDNAITHWALMPSYLANHLSQPIHKPVTTSCRNNCLSPRIRSFRVKLQLALTWCALSKPLGLPLPLSLHNPLKMLPHWAYRHCVPKGKKKCQIGGKEQGECLTWLPTILASISMCGLQYNVIDDPWI